MQNSKISKIRAMFLSTQEMRFLLLITIILFSSHLYEMQAQASLSIQGILKKTSGEAVADNTYNLTFKLYTQQTGGTAIWTEIQSNVEVTSGIYSTVLGNITPLSIAFNQLYYLGVTVGSTEMTPRIQLTSAPYALSIIGNTNQFPSSGLVLADSIKVNGGVLAKGGAPGVNGANRNGYAFSGNSGDKDSGLFSTSDGEVSLYVNNVEVIEVKPGLATVAGDLAFPTGGNVRYNGLDDWRLVTVNTFESNTEGWKVYNALSGEFIGWNNATNAGDPPIEGSVNSFQGRYLRPLQNSQVLKKYFDLTGVGAYNYIKVKFNYYTIDTWGWGIGDLAFAAFASGANGDQMRVGWSEVPSTTSNNGQLNTTAFNTQNNWGGNPAQQYSDSFHNVEMTAFKNGNGFWLFIGCALDQNSSDESYGVGMIEIWVK